MTEFSITSRKDKYPWLLMGVGDFFHVDKESDPVSYGCVRQNVHYANKRFAGDKWFVYERESPTLFKITRQR